MFTMSISEIEGAIITIFQFLPRMDLVDIYPLKDREGNGRDDYWIAYHI